MTETLLSVKKAADRLGLAPFTVRTWLKDKKLRGFKLPGKSGKGVWRIPESAVIAIEEGRAEDAGYGNAEVAPRKADPVQDERPRKDGKFASKSSGNVASKSNTPAAKKTAGRQK